VNTAEIINSKLSTNVATLFTPEFLNNYAAGEKYAPLRTSLVRNSVDAWKTTTPTIVVHGTGDKLVTPTVTTKIYQEFLAAGTDASMITLVQVPGLGHQEAVLPWGITTLKWILDIRGN
jgi:pimeloyl-ACP methyl ester carboxylesterase